MSERWLLLLGSNRERRDTLDAALQRLTTLGVVEVVAAPRAMRPASGRGPDYFNALAIIVATGEAGDLKRRLRAIETALGRDRTQRQCVAIDIDLLAHDAGSGWRADPHAIEKGDVGSWPAVELLREAGIVVHTVGEESA